jgi:hypothetical protein
MNDWVKLSGINEVASDELSTFATKRGAGAEKIADSAKEKGGVSLLTYHHFKVKLSYYKKVADGTFDFDSMKKEYVKKCSELHSHMKNIEEMDQIKFQEIVGEIEVLGEILIKNKSD